MFLEVSNGINSTYKYRYDLHEDGFAFENNKWKIEGKKKELKRFKKKYRKKGLSCIMYDNNVVRSTDYRKNFFQKNKGLRIFHKKYYRCAYCGKLVKKDCITVDHIIPVHKSQRSLIAKMLMKMFRIKNINEYENLTPSCSKCNSKKGSKLAVKYLYNGVTGKIGSGIVVRRIVNLLIFFLIVCLAFMLSQILSNYFPLK